MKKPVIKVDHEKQMRLFNDTMSALALNAYEINNINEQLGKKIEIRNNKLNKIEN